MKTEDYKGEKVLVAVSGGADSVALLCILHERGADIAGALHCNFHLRGEESDRDERFVAALCERLGIALHIQHFDTRGYAREKGISLEMAARELRYQWFEEMRQRLRADDIAVAHHQSDQAETVLLNLIRGTGVRGLAGMRPRNGHIIRPLLGTSKQEILDYLSRIGQDYVTDSTNQERDALRNRLRLDVLPLLSEINPQAIRHIAMAASRVAEALPESTLHDELQGMGFTPAQEEEMLRDMEGQSGKVVESKTHRLLRDRGRLVIEEKRKEDAPPRLTTRVMETEDALGYVRSQPLTADYAYVDADKLTGDITLRHPQRGDRFRPYGMEGRSRLVSDFLTDRKLSLFDKQRQWLACSGGEIVWIVGLRSDHRFRVTRDTRRIMVLHEEKQAMQDKEKGPL